MALAEAARRSSSVLPCFFWLRSRAAWAFWTLDPFPMVNAVDDAGVRGRRNVGRRTLLGEVDNDAELLFRIW